MINVIVLKLFPAYVCSVKLLNDNEMENQLVKLPAEVEQLAQGVVSEKRNEVLSVLNHVFEGVSSMREQLDAVAVKDENDTASMKVANTIRLNVRRVRLDAEDVFDAKRAEVQAQMISFKAEDALWLKCKQIMQITTKEIESIAKWKEDTKIRIESERQELKIAQRLQQMQTIKPECQRSDVEFLSDEMFATLLNAAKIEQQKRIEEQQKTEAERIEREKAEEKKNERLRKMFSLGMSWDGVQFVYGDINFHWTDLVCMTDEEFAKAFEGAKNRKKQIIIEQEQEQERIKKDLEEKEAALQAERKKREAEAAEAARKQKEIEDAAKKAQAEAAHKAAAEKKKADEEASALREKIAEQERAEKQRKEDEEAAKKKAAEEEAARQRAEAEAAKKAAAAPDREKLLKLAELIDGISMPELSSNEAAEIATNARGLLDKVVAYINSKAAAL